MHQLFPVGVMTWHRDRGSRRRRRRRSGHARRQHGEARGGEEEERKRSLSFLGFSFLFSRLVSSERAEKKSWDFKTSTLSLFARRRPTFTNAGLNANEYGFCKRFRRSRLLRSPSARWEGSGPILSQQG